MPILLIIGLLCVSPAITAPAPGGDSLITVYEVLESYYFPVGLLPKGVTGYELDSNTGKFAVHLAKTCSFTIQGYNLKYSTEVTGTMSKKKITNLSVGIVSASFPVDNFEASPQCGCGFGSVNGEKWGKFSFKKLLPLLEA